MQFGPKLNKLYSNEDIFPLYCSGHWLLPAARFRKLQRKLLNRMHLARDGAIRPNFDPREVRASSIVSFLRRRKFSVCIFCLSSSESARNKGGRSRAKFSLGVKQGL